MRPRSVLVTDAGRGSALAILRSLGRRGWNAIPATDESLSPGVHSRYAGAPVLHPSPRSDPKAFVEVVLAAVRDRHVDLVVPVTDDAMLPLAAERERFEAHCRLAIPAPEALERAADKWSTLELARQLGVDAPRSCLIRHGDEAVQAAERLGWPVVLKPRRSRVLRRGGIEAFEVTYAADPTDLRAKVATFEGRSELLLQEYCSGVGEGIELLLDRGRPLAALQHRRLREVPIVGGASALRESVPLDPGLYRQALRLLGALEWTGLAMVEFKVGERGAKLLEINGRVWGSLPLAVHAGMDFPRLLAELCLPGHGVVRGLAHPEYRAGVRARNLELDLMWIGSVLLQRRRHAFLPLPRRREGVAALLQLFDPRVRFDVFAWEDPLPGAIELARIARKLARKAASLGSPSR